MSKKTLMSFCQSLTKPTLVLSDTINGEENDLYELANDYLKAVEVVKRIKTQYHEAICVRNSLTL